MRRLEARVVLRDGDRTEVLERGAQTAHDQAAHRLRRDFQQLIERGFFGGMAAGLGIMLGDGILMGDGIVVSSGILITD